MTAIADQPEVSRDLAPPSPRRTAEPPTGAQYLESLRDGRVIYFDGKRVDDVTTHPAFTNAAYSVARMYDSLHDPAKRDVLTFETERGTRSHKFYKIPKSSQDLFEARDAIAEWARMSYGTLSRGPDYKAALVAGLAADAESYGTFADNVRRYFTRWEAQKPTETIQDALREDLRTADGRDPEPSAGIIDSQSVKGADTVGRDTAAMTRVRRSTAASDSSSPTPWACCSR